MSAPHYQTLTREIAANLGPLHTGIPAVMQGFGALSKAALAAGVIDAKTKELIALAIGVATRCDACIGFHCKALVRLGVTLDEVRETLGITIYMGGGPSAMYAANAVAAFEEFSAAKASPAASAG